MLTDAIEEAGFKITAEGENEYYFSKYSSAGQDFGFSVDIGDTVEKFADNVLDYFNDYEPSAEAMLWLDGDGHGINGAPYEMRDVLDDMIECRGFIQELYEIVQSFIQQ